MKTTITGKDMVISNAISERVLKKPPKWNVIWIPTPSFWSV